MFAYTKIMQALAAAGVVPAATDPYFNLTTLLLNTSSTNGAQNNTFLDSSTNNFTITRNGNTTQGTFTPFSQTGWSNYLNGTTDYLTAPANAVFDFSSGDFTIEAWVNPTTSGTERAIISKWNNSGATQSWLLELNSSNFPLFYYSTTGSDLPVLTGTTAISANTWTHIAVTRSGNTWTIWVNGVSSVSSTISSTIYTASATTVNIGRYYGAASYAYWPGYISNARVVKGTAVYTSAFTPPTTPLTAITNTSLLTCQSNRFLDNSSNAFAITTNGTPSVQAFSPFAPTAAYDATVVGGSGYFDGSGDYLTAPNNAALLFGTGDFTVEAWVYANALNSASNNTIACVWSTGQNAWYLAINNSSNVIFGYAAGSTYTFSNTFVINTWYHIAVARSGTSLKAFVNGVQVGTTQTNSTNITSTALLSVGANLDGGPIQYWTGYISGLRVLKGTALYTSAFTPPTAPPTAITNTSLLLNYTNAGIYDATAKNDLETVGNAQVSTTQAKWGTTSMYFDGTGDWLFSSNKPIIDLGSGDWTIEGWVYPAVTGDKTIFAINAIGTGYSQVNVSTSAGGVWYLLASTTSGAWISSVTGGSYSTNNWYHFAAVRNGTSLKLYINGTSVITQSVSGSLYAYNGSLYIGQAGDGTQNFNGYIDDFRITKGYARYTANFTPPTAAFGTQ